MSSSSSSLDVAETKSSNSSGSNKSKTQRNAATDSDVISCFDDDDSDSLASALSDYNSTFYDAQTIPYEQENALLKSSSTTITTTTTTAETAATTTTTATTTSSSSSSTSSRKSPPSDSNFVEGTSTDISFEDNRTDEFVDLLSLEDDEEEMTQQQTNLVNGSLSQHDELVDSGEELTTSNQLSLTETGLSNNQDKTLLSNDEEKDSGENVDDDSEEVNREFENYLNDGDEVHQNDEESDYDETNEQMKHDKLKQLEELPISAENYPLFQKLAIERYGLLNKRCRRRIWPLLILYRDRCFLNSSEKKENTNNDPIPTLDEMIRSSLENFNKISDAEIKSNSYYNQVTLDVVRTLKRFPPEISDRLRSKLQKQLIDLICKILIKHSHLHYYQGYHDICLTFLLVNGAELSIPLLEQLTLSHLTCFMETTMESTLKLLFNVMPLIDKLDDKVAEHIQKAELGVIFGLSWLITWYSHVMDDLMVILRLYDFFIATHPLMPIYVGAIIITDKADVILSTDCDMASLHTIITKFPSNVTDIEQMEVYIEQALELFQKYPPESLADLNEKWLDKCKKMQEEKAFLERLEEERRRLRLRSRKGNKTGASDDYDVFEYTSSMSNNRRHQRAQSETAGSSYDDMALVHPQQFKSRLLFGITVTVGVAAVAMYAINSKDPQDILSKFYHLLSYKNF